MSQDREETLAIQDALTRGFMDRFKLSELHAADYADVAMAVITREWGGQRRYIPKAPGVSVTGEQLAREYNGSNSIEVCARYNISERTLFRKLNEVRRG